MTAYAIHSDHLGTPRQIDDNAGSSVWVWETLTYGATMPNDDPMNTGIHFNYNLRFSGQYYDQESGLFQNWHRDYDPELGRYIESDPIGLSGELNRFSYVGNNPLNYSDPMGLRWIWVEIWLSHWSWPSGGWHPSYSPGHVMVEDTVSQHYTSHYLKGGNDAFIPTWWPGETGDGMNQTIDNSVSLENYAGDPSSGYWVWIPDPIDFNKDINEVNTSKYGVMNNYGNYLNCAEAAAKDLRNGGFEVPSV